MIRLVTALAAAALLASPALHARKQTVCTITVNSPDEREAFREHLAADRYEFIELVERGRPDWLARSCRKGVSCDVLLVSGHFAGTEFYSSRHDAAETLPVDEIERVACSESCPGLFSGLKEVYLFGCDTLNPTPVRAATPEVVRSLVRAGLAPEQAERAASALAERHGESSRDHMRRLFPGVPAIYGFSSKAPYGRYAGPLLARYFASAAGHEIGSGRVSERLHRLFAPASMTVTTGLQATEPNADYRAEACRYFDDRLTPARKLAGIHAILARSMAEARLSLDRIEKFFAALDEAQLGDPAFAASLRAISVDLEARGRYLVLVRDTPDPAARTRLIALARTLGWLTPAEQRVEQMALVAELLATPATGFGEVDLVCSLNRDRALDGQAQHLKSTLRLEGSTVDAALACLGDSGGRARVLKALSSADERDVQVAQAYLRHHPIADAEELRTVARQVARMPGSAAQVRALETLARQRIADPQALEELTRLYIRATSLAVQRAIAEVFIRADYREPGDLVHLLQRHRLGSAGGDLIDVLIKRLQS